MYVSARFVPVNVAMMPSAPQKSYGGKVLNAFIAESSVKILTTMVSNLAQYFKEGPSYKQQAGRSDMANGSFPPITAIRRLMLAPS